MEVDLGHKLILDGRWPLMEDDHCRKITIDGWRPLTKDDLWPKTTFDGRWLLMEDNLWQTHPLTEDNLWWKTAFDRRRPSTEDDLQQKTTFDRRRASTEDNLQQKMTFNGRLLLIERFWDSALWYTAVAVIFICVSEDQPDANKGRVKKKTGKLVTSAKLHHTPSLLSLIMTKQIWTKGWKFDPLPS